MLQIDTNGDGTADMDISLQNDTGTLTSSHVLLSQGKAAQHTHRDLEAAHRARLLLFLKSGRRRLPFF
ncbi:hypothetical protein JQ629_00995 [Bradyrhizobium sp. AUGA SZCCT0222]|uniref:hypothetical protein n=1 Tax=Bradyrhizobium sp. AUGA SZCCT0222 TaxID=2807668 RepID=UPI001BA7CC1B|nr:hypothetical protein [Bradyrhizobium sp. AUGA SZCCT0222]MBR1266080.1 hypothetical protein [Bradyrhizobium sp. AUGA SZCCT0222]